MKKFLKKRILPLVAVLVLFIGTLVLPASAYSFNASEYTNLIVWSHAPETTINDVENYMDMMTLLPNGMWRYDGQGGSKSFGDVVLAEFTLPAGQYSISSNAYLSDAEFYLELPSGYGGCVLTERSHSFNCVAAGNYRLILRRGCSSSLPSEDLWFMMNCGSEPSPYVLPLNWVFKYSDQVGSGSNYTKGDLVATFTAEYGSIPASESLTAGQNYFVEDTLFCAKAGPMEDYAAPPEGTVFIASTGREYEVSWLDPSSWGISATDGSAPDSEFTINIYAAIYNVDTDASYTEEDINEAYQNGFDMGWLDGWNDATSDYAEIMEQKVAESYDKGFGAGYNDGYIEGKKEGIEISENGDWIGLMTAVVEAPVNTFQSLFNFNVLGLDMRVAFGSILTLCLLLIVIKKVLL